MYKIPANTLFVGKNLIFVPECHSTNSLALQSAQNPSAVEGTLIITDNQTAGRGQRGNAWEAEAGKNLTFSIILRPGFLAVKDQFYLNIIASLAVHDVITEKIQGPVAIKWPNDILVHGKKICGILVENQIQGERFSASVVGIGLNVNQTQFSSGSPTSLKDVTGNTETLQSVLDGLLGCLEARYLQLRQGDYAVLKQMYLQRLYRRHEKHVFEAAGVEFEGSIATVDDAGRLVVTTAEGDRTFGVKEIRFANQT